MEVQDTRPNGFVKWQTTIVDEYEATFTPEQMESFGFEFINGEWSTDGENGWRIADELADADDGESSLVDCRREVMEVSNTNDKPDD